MSSFPTLRTGAVMQYPADRQLRCSTQIVTFLDGSEQRFAGFARPYRRWVVQLSALDESEMEATLVFMREQSGAANTFSFTDPWDGAVYPSCSLDQNSLTHDWKDAGAGATQLVIKENKST